MDVLWVLLVSSCFLLSCGEDHDASAHGTEPNEEKAHEVELFPPRPTFAGQTRMPRTLFKKLHSKAAFLTGLKLGAVLSKKGFELGHGKIASTHSFKIFGKSVNSATSLSYGDAGSLLPLVDDDPQVKTPERTALDKGDQKVFHVTVIENLSNETGKEPLGKEADEEKPNEDDSDGSKSKRSDLALLYRDAAGEAPETEANFLEEHNKRVKEFNEKILRRKNSKF